MTFGVIFQTPEAYDFYVAEVAGIVGGCRMKCDEQPCKNQGVCIEDFSKGEASCNCQLTSYYGEFCGQGK
jgi:hypothetical protein